MGESVEAASGVGVYENKLHAQQCEKPTPKHAEVQVATYGGVPGEVD